MSKAIEPLPEWTIRRGRASDGPFIINAWLKSLNEHTRVFDRKCGFWRAHKAVIASLLEEPGCKVYVAVIEEDDDKILAWAVGEVGHDLVLHYTYTKQRWRRRGLADALISRLRGDCRGMCSVVTTHEGSLWAREKRKSRAWVFSPRGIFYRMILREAQLEKRATA